MHPQSHIHTITSMDDQQHQHLHQDLDHHGDNQSNEQIMLNCGPDVQNDLDLDQEDEDMMYYGENILNYEAEPSYCMANNAPDSYAVCGTKVADWLDRLDRSTFMERKASVKFSCQTRVSRRTVSLNQRPNKQLSIIGFRKKPVQEKDGKLKSNDRMENRNVRLFRNRSEPGRDYCLLITEPVSPRVSCVGRVGSVRVKGRKAGVWRSFKAAFSNLVQTNRMTKISA